MKHLISSLGDWIGTRLFTRSAQGAGLTAAGACLRPLVEDIVRKLERARDEARSAGERQAASLSIAATHALSFTFFPAWIRQHLHLEAVGPINLVSDSMEACEESMLCGEVHFLLCHHHTSMRTRFEADRFESVCVGQDRLVPLSAPDANGKPVWPIVQSGYPGKPTRLLGYSQASGLGRILAAHPTGGMAHVESRFTSHLAATLMTMAREGQGAAWLPLTLAQDDVVAGRLVRAGPETRDVPIEIRIFRSADCRNAAADALWRHLTAPS